MRRFAAFLYLVLQEPHVRCYECFNFLRISGPDDRSKNIYYVGCAKSGPRVAEAGTAEYCTEASRHKDAHGSNASPLCHSWTDKLQGPSKHAPNARRPADARPWRCPQPFRVRTPQFVLTYCMQQECNQRKFTLTQTSSVIALKQTFTSYGGSRCVCFSVVGQRMLS